MSRAPVQTHTDIAISSNGLLFQFVLDEFLETQQQARALLTDSPEDQALFQALDGMLSPDFSFPWRLNRTPIVKLSDYCRELARQSHLEKAEELAALSQRTVDEAYRGWRQVKEQGQNVQDLAQKICRRLKRMGKQISELWPDFSDDENVIFYLLRRQHDFEQALGERAFRRSWRNLCPEGQGRVLEFLTERYCRRGFDHLIPVIEKYVVDLDG